MRLRIKRLMWIAVAAAVVFAGPLVWNLARFESKQRQVEPIAVRELDDDALLARFVGAVRIPTVSQPLSRIDQQSPLFRLHDYLQQAFPALHAPPFIRRSGLDFGDALNPSILFEWPGRAPELGGVLLMSHLDVVDAGGPTDSNRWTHPPFAGHYDGTYIWGRGTLDCKHGVMAILEAIRLLASEGFQPQRTVYVAIGHDEELGGRDGNRHVAEWLRNRLRQDARKLHVVLDEGGCIFTEFPGLDRPAALVGVAEKGFADVELTVRMAADQVGHASMPPRETAVTILASALHRIQAAPFPPRLDGGLHQTLEFLGPEMPSLASRLAVANRWLFSRLIRRQLSRSPSGDAMLRTTIAPTLLAVDGDRANVLPRSATATLNLRLLPGDDLESVVRYLRDVIDDDRVTLSLPRPGRGASPVSSVDSPAFDTLHRTIREVYPDVVVAPFVLVGGTDTVHYLDLCDQIFRFIPARLDERDTKRFHGIDERISLDDYLQIVRFYCRFIESATDAPASRP